MTARWRCFRRKIAVIIRTIIILSAPRGGKAGIKINRTSAVELTFLQPSPFYSRTETDTVHFIEKPTEAKHGGNLEGAGGEKICTQHGFYVSQIRCDEMAHAGKEPKRTNRVVLVKRIIMNDDNNPVGEYNLFSPSF